MRSTAPSVPLSYPDNLHPDVHVPPHPRKGWPEMASLYSWRLNEGISRPELAAACGRSVDTLRVWERGIVALPPRRLAVYRAAIVRVLDSRRARGRLALEELPPAHRDRAEALLVELATLAPDDEPPRQWLERLASAAS